MAIEITTEDIYDKKENENEKNSENVEDKEDESWVKEKLKEKFGEDIEVKDLKDVSQIKEILKEKTNKQVKFIDLDKAINRKIKNHKHEEYKASNTYKYLIGERPKRFLEGIMGTYYTIIHSLFVLLVGYLICFVNDLRYLVIGLLIISLDAHANIVLHDCPLSMLEDKYLEKSGIETRLEFLRGLGIMYSLDSRYDAQLETIINAWSLIAGKILMLICFRNFTSRNFVN